MNLRNYTEAPNRSLKAVINLKQRTLPGGVCKMTSEDFVGAIRRVVLDRAVDSALAAVERPPGRRPRQKLLAANEWYERLSAEERTHLRAVATMVAHQTVFGLFAVLDGARVIEDSPEKGEFSLLFKKGNQQWELNPPNGVPLHEILNQSPGTVA
jgi:hypothetical protein